MDDAQILDRMREDWNRRAAEDANYYVAFRQRDQDEDEFFAMGAPELARLEADLPRLPGRDAALEIGCGPGRLMRPLSRHFKEIHGVDVSDGMIALARGRLRSTPNAFPHHSSGCDLKLFPDEKFDFVYSYAVFQHIPSVEVVFQYLQESRRVLKIGGILQCQVNGLPPAAEQYNTWNGARIGSREIAHFALQNDFQFLGLEAIDAQYMWVTLRKRPAGPGLSRWPEPVSKASRPERVSKAARRVRPKPASKAACRFRPKPVSKATHRFATSPMLSPRTTPSRRPPARWPRSRCGSSVCRTSATSTTWRLASMASPGASNSSGRFVTAPSA